MQFVQIVHEDPDIAPAVVSAGAASAYAKRGWQLKSLVDDPTPVESPKRELKRPQKNDSTAAWRTYAVALGPENGGLALTEAFDMSRDDLVAKYTADDPKPSPAPSPAPKPKPARKRAAKPAAQPAPAEPAVEPTETSTAPAGTPDTTKES